MHAEQQCSDPGCRSQRQQLLPALKFLLSGPALPVISITWGAFKTLNAQAIPQPIKFHLWEVELRHEDLRENESTFYLEIQSPT